MKIPSSLPDGEGDDSPAGDDVDPAADDPRCGDRGEASHNVASSSSVSSSSYCQSTLGEWASAESGATAPAGDSPPASLDGDHDRDRVRELAAANAEQIDTLGNTLDWLTKLVLERTDSPGEAAVDDPSDTADRGFQ